VHLQSTSKVSREKTSILKGEGSREKRKLKEVYTKNLRKEVWLVNLMTRFLLGSIIKKVVSKGTDITKAQNMTKEVQRITLKIQN
jgi:hypothetical protein